jgi:hypothetical protein
MDKSWDIDGVNPILNPKVNLPSRDVFIEPIYGDIGGDLPLGLSHCHSTQYQMSAIDLSTYVYLNMDLCLFVSVYRIAYIYQHPPYCMYIYIYISLSKSLLAQKDTNMYTHQSLQTKFVNLYISTFPPLSLSGWKWPFELSTYLSIYPCIYLPIHAPICLSLFLPMDLPCVYMNIISLYLFISQSIHPWDCTLNLSYVEMQIISTDISEYIWYNKSYVALLWPYQKTRSLPSAWSRKNASLHWINDAQPSLIYCNLKG